MDTDNGVVRAWEGAKAEDGNKLREVNGGKRRTFNNKDLINKQTNKLILYFKKFNY